MSALYAVDRKKSEGADVVRLHNSDPWKHAQLCVRTLHMGLQQLDPESHLWRRLTVPELARFADQPDLLSQAWDSKSHVLLDRAVYDAVLDLVEASQVARHAVSKAYWRAFHAIRTAVAADETAASPSTPNTSASPSKPGRRWFGDKIPPQTLRAMMVERVSVIDAEDAFLEHLRVLMDLSGYSARTLHAALKKVVRHSPSHTTITNWLRSTKIPKGMTEEMLVGLVTVFAEALTVGTEVTSVSMVITHRRTYRRLIVARNAARFDAGPVPRALAALAAEEDALPPDHPERRHLQLARQALLRAVGAHELLLEA